MRARFIKVAGCALGFALCAGPALAQTSSRPAGPPEPTSKLTFPANARFGFVDVDRVASLSKEGRSAAAKLQELRKQKESEVTERSRKVEELQQKMLTSETLLNDVARTRLEREVQRAQMELRQFTEQARADVQYLQQDLLRAFTARLFPIIGEVAKERDLLAVFSSNSGIIWHDPAIDLSEEIARRLDSAESQ